MAVTWKKNKNVAKQLYFTEIAVGATFRNLNGRGAVYMKIRDEWDDEHMLELATGKMFDPTQSPLEYVNVDIIIDAEKPQIHGY